MARSQNVPAASTRHRVRRDGTVAVHVRYWLDGRSKTLFFTDSQSAERWAMGDGRWACKASGRPRRCCRSATRTPPACRHSTSGPAVHDLADRARRIHARGLPNYMHPSISPILGALPLAAISPARIASWVNEMTGCYAGKTIANRHGFLYACLQAAVEDQLIRRNPCGRIRPPARRRSSASASPSPSTSHCSPTYPGSSRVRVDPRRRSGPTRTSSRTCSRSRRVDGSAAPLQSGRHAHRYSNICSMAAI